MDYRALDLMEEAVAGYIFLALEALENKKDFGMGADLLEKASVCSRIRSEMGKSNDEHSVIVLGELQPGA